MFGLFKKKQPKETEPFQAKILFKPKEPRTVSQIGPRKNVWGKLKNIAIGLISLILIIAIVLGLYALFNSEEFKIKSFEFIGNKEVEDGEILEAISSVKGKSLFLTNAFTISDTIKQNFPLFKSVVVKKIYPDLIKVIVSEKEPQLILINLNGSYLIDEEGFVIEVISSDSIKFPEDKVDIARGIGDPNSDIVRDLIYADWKFAKTKKTDLSAEEEAALAKQFDFNAVPLEQKQAKLQVIQTELLSEINSFLEKHAQLVAQTVYAGLPRVYMVNANKIEKNQIISENKLNLTAEVARFFNQHQEFVLAKIYWEGEVLVRFEFTNGKQIVFGTNRKASEQLEDLLLVLSKLQQEGKSYTRIDVSSKKISVK